MLFLHLYVTINRTLQKIRSDKARGILIVPDWPNQPWYNRYIALTVKEIVLYPRENLVLMPTDSEVKHPLHKSLSLRVGLVSATGL